MLDTATVISKAREICGSKTSRAVGEDFATDLAIKYGMASAIRSVNQIFGDNTARKEATFTTVANQWEYTLTTIASDIASIDEVIRSGTEDMFAGNNPDTIFDSHGNALPFDHDHIIDQGMQQDVWDLIVAQRRRRRNDEYSFEEFNGKLRLYPCPSGSETVIVKYTTSGATTESLPDEAEPCLVYAACVAILDTTINRLNSDRYTGATHGVVSEDRIKTLEKQRDRYEEMYRSELARLEAKG